MPFSRMPSHSADFLLEECPAARVKRDLPMADKSPPRDTGGQVRFAPTIYGKCVRFKNLLTYHKVVYYRVLTCGMAIVSVQV
jgi:hypothetical protein